MTMLATALKQARLDVIMDNEVMPAFHQVKETGRAIIEQAWDDELEPTEAALILTSMTFDLVNNDILLGLLHYEVFRRWFGCVGNNAPIPELD